MKSKRKNINKTKHKKNTLKGFIELKCAYGSKKTQFTHIMDSSQSLARYCRIDDEDWGVWQPKKEEEAEIPKRSYQNDDHFFVVVLLPLVYDAPNDVNVVVFLCDKATVKLNTKWVNMVTTVVAQNFYFLFALESG